MFLQMKKLLHYYYTKFLEDLSKIFDQGNPGRTLEYLKDDFQNSN